MCTYWQISAAYDQNQRNYSDLFLKYGIAFTALGTGLKNMNLGDIMVLKRGINAIKAVGVIVERDGIYRGHIDENGYVVDQEGHVHRDKRKEWLLDLDGWAFPEFCCVDWKQPDKLKEVDGLVMGPLRRIYQSDIIDKANYILETGTTVPILPEPSETSEVTDDDTLKFLIREGLRPSSSYEITSTISKIRLLADYYDKQFENPWENILEHEIRTFLVVPLLLALGWSEQKIKIELACGGNKRVDIAYFRKPCRSDNREEWKKECVAIIETKSFRSGLDYAHEQATTYSMYFPHCQAVITTNGYCYKVYLRNQCNQFQTTPSAYLNLLRQRDRYPLDPEKVGGALEAIKWLLPNNLITIPKEPGH